MSNFNIRVYSPAGLLFEKSAAAVVFPGADGEVGVLPGHAPYVGLIGTGTLSIFEREGSSGSEWAVSGGVTTYAEGVLNLLADAVVTAGSEEHTALRNEKEELEALSASEGGESAERQSAIKKLKLLEALESSHS